VTAGPQLSDVWTAAGVLLGLQGAVFTQRVHREVTVGQSGDVTWLPRADMVNLASALTTIFGVFILPIFVADAVAKYAFALAVLLFAGHLFALAGHYEMYNPNTPRSFEYFPRQEQVVITVVGFVAALYVVVAIVYAIQN
jgi:hypothetical protein